MIKIVLGFFVAAVVVLSQNQHEYCRVCEYVIGTAEHHFGKNITDKGALKTQLLNECQHLRTNEQQHCLTLVNTQIDKIYADLTAGDRVRQTCQDLGECPARPTRNQ